MDWLFLEYGYLVSKRKSGSMDVIWQCYTGKLCLCCFERSCHRSLSSIACIILANLLCPYASTTFKINMKSEKSLRFGMEKPPSTSKRRRVQQTTMSYIVFVRVIHIINGEINSFRITPKICSGGHICHCNHLREKKRVEVIILHKQSKKREIMIDQMRSCDK